MAAAWSSVSQVSGRLLHSRTPSDIPWLPHGHLCPKWLAHSCLLSNSTWYSWLPHGHLCPKWLAHSCLLSNSTWYSWLPHGYLCPKWLAHSCLLSNSTWCSWLQSGHMRPMWWLAALLNNHTRYSGCRMFIPFRLKEAQHHPLVIFISCRTGRLSVRITHRRIKGWRPSGHCSDCIRDPRHINQTVLEILWRLIRPY
jgi:hypothetical protein